MARKSCDEAIARVYHYLDGELTWFRKLRINRHLRACRPCEGAYHFERRLKAVVREHSREDVPPEVLERLRSILRNEEN
jgi:mycothiol system anti-sigma-R factor